MPDLIFYSSVRDFLGSQPVTEKEVPPWLMTILRDFVTGQAWDLDRSTDSELLDEVVAELCPGAEWFMYWGTSEGNLVCEPFEFDATTAASLNTLCSTLEGISWKVGSNVWLNPGNTVRITIYPEP